MRRGPGLLIIPERGCVCTLRLPSFPTVREGSKWRSGTENKEEWIFCTRRFHFLNNSPINSFFSPFRRFDPCFSRGGKLLFGSETYPQVWSRSGNNHLTSSPIVRELLNESPVRWSHYRSSHSRRLAEPSLPGSPSVHRSIHYRNDTSKEETYHASSIISRNLQRSRTVTVITSPLMESHHQNLLVHQPLEYRIAPNAREQKIRLNTSDNGENCDPPLSLFSSSFFQRRGCFARFLRVALFRGQISSNVSHERDRRTVSFNTPDNERQTFVTC